MIDLEEALLRATTVGTMLDEPQLCYLYALATMSPNGIAVECGVYKGGSLAVWSAAREGRGLIYAIDSWEEPGWSGALPHFEDTVARFAIPVMVLRVNSFEAPAMIGSPVAFCFIDADHAVGIRQDMTVWPDAIMPGGILALHDYDVPNPTVAVRDAVDRWQISARWHRLGIVGSTIAFMRPRGPKIGGVK